MRINLSKARALLLQGSVVAVPTETVYGMAASLKHLQAIEQIFSLKKRPLEKPLPILIGNIHQLSPLISGLPQGAEELIRIFWPGPLTLVLPANKKVVPDQVRAGLPAVGVRMPDHSLTTALLQEVGPVVATSVNLSGEPSITCAEDIERDFGKDFPVLDDGPSSLGQESTVAAWTKSGWEILREGAISAEKIEASLSVQ